MRHLSCSASRRNGALFNCNFCYQLVVCLANRRTCNTRVLTLFFAAVPLVEGARRVYTCKLLDNADRRTTEETFQDRYSNRRQSKTRTIFFERMAATTRVLKGYYILNYIAHQIVFFAGVNMHDLYDYIMLKYWNARNLGIFFRQFDKAERFFWRDAREVGVERRALADIKHTYLVFALSTTTIAAISWTRFCGSTPSNILQRQDCKGS